MRTPDVFLADDIKDWSVSAELHPGCYSLARPYSWQGVNLVRRLRIAWRVFTGRYDALCWDSRAAQRR